MPPATWQVETREGEVAEYQANAGQSCLHCKTTLYSTLQSVAARAAQAAAATAGGATRAETETEAVAATGQAMAVRGAAATPQGTGTGTGTAARTGTGGAEPSQAQAQATRGVEVTEARDAARLGEGHERGVGEECAIGETAMMYSTSSDVSLSPQQRQGGMLRVTVRYSACIVPLV